MYFQRLQRVLGERRDAQLAIAVGTDNPALEEGTLVNDVEPLGDVRCKTNRKSCQGQSLRPRTAKLPVADPRRLPAVRAQRLELDVAGQQCIEWADAEGF